MCGLCQLASLSLSLSLKMGRQPCCEKVGLRKGPWTAEEDEKLANFILTNGQCCWTAVPKLAGLTRCGKNCRLRWINYLRPGLKRGILSPDEEKMVIEFHALVGSRWSKIASHLPGRTDNEIKNQWNTHIKKKLIKMGIDPATHQPLRPAAAAQQPPQAPPSENNVKQTEEVANPAESSSARIDDSYQSHPTGLAYNNFYIDEIPAAVETHQILLSSNDNNSPLTAPSSFTSPSPSSSSYSLGPLQFSPILDHNYGVTVIDSIWSDDFSGLDLQMMINRDRS